ncbi:unnamed protein product [Penicillium salamii]|nr:unnamed protein product [Penicillium salamii]
MKVSPVAQTIAASQKKSLFGKTSLPPSPFDLPNRQPSIFGSIASFTTELTVPGTFGTHHSLFGPGAGISPGSGLPSPVAETPGASKSLFGTGTGTAPAREGNKPSLFGPGAGTGHSSSLAPPAPGTTDSSSSLFGRSSGVAPQSHSLFGPPVSVIHVYKLLISLFVANTWCTA